MPVRLSWTRQLAVVFGAGLVFQGARSSDKVSSMNSHQSRAAFTASLACREPRPVRVDPGPWPVPKLRDGDRSSRDPALLGERVSVALE